MINHLHEKLSNDPHIGVVSVYFDYNNLQKPSEVLYDVYRQLLRRHNGVFPTLLHALIEKMTHESRSPTDDELANLVKSEAKTLSQLFIVIDALDECVGSSTDETRPEKHVRFRRNVYGLLQSLSGQANVLVTSRVSEEIPSMFKRYPQIEISAHDEDMIAYLEQRIADGGDEHRWAQLCSKDTMFKDESIRKLIEKANGM